MTDHRFSRPLNILSQTFNKTAASDIALETGRASDFRADDHVDIALQTKDGDLLFGSYGRFYFKTADSKEAHEIQTIACRGNMSMNGFDPFSFEIRDDLNIYKKLGSFSYSNGRGILMLENNDTRLFKPLGRDARNALIDQILGGEILCLAQPEVRLVSDAFDIGGGEQLIVSTRMGHDYNAKNTSVFIKKDDDIRQLGITGINSFGDTAFLNTTEGTLYIVSPNGPRSAGWAKTHTWNNAPVTRLDIITVANDIGDKNLKVQGYKKAAAPSA
jgi:hypothetical protein